MKLSCLKSELESSIHCGNGRTLEHRSKLIVVEMHLLSVIWNLMEGSKILEVEEMHHAKIFMKIVKMHFITIL